MLPSVSIISIARDLNKNNLVFWLQKGNEQKDKKITIHGISPFYTHIQRYMIIKTI